MQDLQELVYILQHHRLGAINIIGAEGTPSKVHEFYEGLVDGTFATDEAASEHFYGTPDKPQSYHKLRQSLRSRLINTLFFVDINQPYYNERQKAYYECYKDWAAVKILFGKNARTAAVSLSHKILRQARRFEFTELILDISRTLRLHYGAREGDIKKYDQYNAMYKECDEVFRKENLAEELYTDIILRYVNRKALDEDVHKKAKEYYAELVPHLEQYDSYRLHLCGILIRMLIYTTINDYQNTIKICEEGIAYFEQKSYVAAIPLQVCYYQLIICYTQLKEYEQGEAAVVRCAEFIDKGSFNWFKYHELHFMLSIHTKNYDIAYEILEKVLQHKRFQFLHESMKETWRIFEGYTYYLVEIGKIQTEVGKRKLKKFRVGKFINETPIFSKDKRGMNIPILVIQIIYMILKKDYDTAIDKIEAINKYCVRYLHQDDTFRSNCFIKMLLQIPAASFHRVAVERKASRYYEKLINTPLEVANQSHEIEIIPYEELWEMVLNTLQSKFPRKRRKQQVSTP
jgi:hypothetical protein